MSSSAPLPSQLTLDVLMALWRAEEKSEAVSIQDLLRATLAPLPHIQEALGNLAARGCHIERTPSEVRLASVGLRSWRDLLMECARREHWRIGRQVHVLPTAASTNDLALFAMEGADPDGLVILADEQTAGRGRMGRSWVAKAGQSVLMSMLLVNVSPEWVERLTLLAALAAARALENACAQAGVLRVEIKWPNDLLVGGKKLAGILVERRAAAGGAGGHGGGSGTVVGIGINVGQGAGDFPAELAGRATSLFECMGRQMDRARIIVAILREFNFYCGAAIRDEVWVNDWKGRCPMLGQTIRVRSGDIIREGRVLDISPLQGLLIRDESDGTHFLTSQTSTLVD